MRRAAPRTGVGTPSKISTRSLVPMRSASDAWLTKVLGHLQDLDGKRECGCADSGFARKGIETPFKISTSSSGRRRFITFSVQRYREALKILTTTARRMAYLNKGIGTPSRSRLADRDGRSESQRYWDAFKISTYVLLVICVIQ